MVDLSRIDRDTILPISNIDRDLLPLAACLGIPVLTENTESHHSARILVMAPLIDPFCYKHQNYPTHLEQRQRKTKACTIQRTEFPSAIPSEAKHRSLRL